MKSGLSKWLFYLALLPATLGLCAWQGWAWWSWASAPVESASDVSADLDASPPSASDQAVQLKILEGTSGQQIGQDLQAAGLIRSATAWKLWTRWQTILDAEGGFQAGTYELSPAESLSAIANKIWTGDVKQLSVTIPEGWSLQEMANHFEAQGFFSATDFMAATRRIPQDFYPWLPSSLPHLEGFLYPDTYQLVAEQITPDRIINQMLGRFEELALPVYQQAQTQLNLLEWVTLASIVEQETVVDDERDIIAGVFTRRLRERIPLGADPTVEYALGIHQTADQPLTFRQVETPSPYNTYINVGLPPTPIASPSVKSLKSSLYPQITEYLYFVAKYDGTHIFSRTQAEHEAAQAAIWDERLAQKQNAAVQN
ncbi:MAG: endolytic transglycosylase MltG [Cyanothece sp. SIO1E1]|nr:endolytic transglycosylase MltG [Cyanothece sp. SIO1E1]